MTLAHEEPSGPVAAPRRRSSPVILLLEWILVVAAAIGTAVLIRTYVAQTFYIPSASMSPTLRVDDRIVIDKVTYRFRDPHRGDIVVFRGPPRTQLAGIDLVKRVVGLPGDRVAAVDGRIEVNGRRVAEPYLPGGGAGRSFDFLPFTVPAGSYFVMGDNRSGSNDSRIFGPVRREDIIGRAMIRIWPFSRLGSL